ncbi:MAG TPA: hypothetical protein ACFCUD_07165 [Cyclobacteriaceae bacterium]
MILNPRLIISLCILFAVFGCTNRDVNPVDSASREIHEDIEFHFDEIQVDGEPYLILERDRNNPHEGFGFMAWKGNRSSKKQDSIFAYLKAVSEMQIRILSNLEEQPEYIIEEERDTLVSRYLRKKP